MDDVERPLTIDSLVGIVALVVHHKYNASNVEKQT